MNLFFWVLLNLGVPIIGPIFTLVLVAPAHGWHVAKALIAGSVKDGQLFWCAIGLCASALYEVVTALARGSAEAPVLAYYAAGLCVAAFTCSSLVMSGLVNTHYERTRTKASPRNKPFADGAFSRMEIAMSILFACGAAFILAFLHVHLR
ncbi:hypothetical protein B0G81_6982 [Paraburkholderia sp. BL6665CI2N2]|uniref:hypothetical protein n=1 Tax=Paraburkholderia sp. BL6665CI2N2 TaxID=1938806 RepID=UPI0010648DCD|nr:hypothetical protein [Paraburkholderia sp. BL6665CI2N2]TDY26466.1 hypothetical protein B0G81_6982 [Paraburkholderia sp. BL6665CI2N2]